MDDIPGDQQRLYLLRLRDEARALAQDCAHVADIAEAAADGRVAPGMLPLHLDRYIHAMARESPDVTVPADLTGRIGAWLAAVGTALDHIRVETAILLRWRSSRR